MIGVTLGVISYIPRVIVEGLGNLGRKDNHKPVSAARLQKALDVEHLALDIGKAPLDYSREDKHYSNYQNPDDPQAGIRKYTARFFVLNNDNTDRKEHFSHSKHAHQTNHTHQENTYDKLPDSTATPAPSAPPLDQHEVKQYDDYVLNASKFSPSCGFD